MIRSFPQFGLAAFAALALASSGLAVSLSAQESDPKPGARPKPAEGKPAEGKPEGAKPESGKPGEGGSKEPGAGEPKPDAKPARFKGDELFAPPAPEEARNRTLEAVAAKAGRDQALLDRVAKVWTFADDESPSRQVLDRVVATAALVDPKAAEFVAACQKADIAAKPPDPSFLNGAPADDWFASHLRLFYGRWLAEHRMYDEGMAALEPLDPKKLVDPATWLFYTAVCQHQLLLKAEALATLKLLLKNTESVPPSYSAVATLMQYELEALNPKTLGIIARKMSDSERRLELSRAGERVQKVQDEIIAELDELIERLEQQGGGGGGGGGDGKSNSNQSSSPANDSTVKGAKGTGDVDKKQLGKTGGWGNLGEKEQAKAKNLIGRRFPAHYRQAVEEYFKKLADRPAGAGK